MRRRRTGIVSPGGAGRDRQMPTSGTARSVQLQCRQRSSIGWSAGRAAVPTFGFMAGRVWMAGLGSALMVVALTVAAPASAAPGGHYDHLFVIVEENHGFADVIGNPAAPNLNALAARYGLATAYFGVAHPSEPNYVGLLGGDTFGVADDNPYYLNRVHAPSLVSQLDAAGIGWKAYLQGS